MVFLQMNSQALSVIKSTADRYFLEQCQRLGPIDGVPPPLKTALVKEAKPIETFLDNYPLRENVPRNTEGPEANDPFELMKQQGYTTLEIESGTWDWPYPPHVEQD